MRFRGWHDKRVHIGSSHPLPWAETSDFLALLVESLIIFLVERCWLVAGLTRAVLEEAADEMGSLGALFYWLASCYCIYWQVQVFVSCYSVTSSQVAHAVGHCFISNEAGLQLYWQCSETSSW